VKGTEWLWQTQTVHDRHRLSMTDRYSPNRHRLYMTDTETPNLRSFVAKKSQQYTHFHGIFFLQKFVLADKKYFVEAWLSCTSCTSTSHTSFTVKASLPPPPAHYARGKALAIFPDMARWNLLQIKAAGEGYSKFTLRGRILWESPRKKKKKCELNL